MADGVLPEHGAIAAPDGLADDVDEDGGVEERVAAVGVAEHGERLDKAIVAFVPELGLEGLQSPFTALPIQIFNWVSRPQAGFHVNAAAAIVVGIYPDRRTSEWRVAELKAEGRDIISLSGIRFS